MATVLDTPFTEDQKEYYVQYGRVNARPPGTGKTYLGLKIVEQLLLNKKKWNKNHAPVIVFCQTNHALDQFLRQALKITDNLIRVGSQSKEPLLEKYNLTEIRQEQQKYDFFIKNSLEDNVQILRGADIVGFTISGGAKYSEHIKLIEPQIVVIEEASEILESQTLSVINEGLKHLIMIGDHRQLTPILQCHELKEKNWNISLFERLIRNNIPSSFLGIQKRMRPEIANYIREIYGEDYKDDESVKSYEDVKGFQGNVQLFSYQVDQNKIEHRKKNTKTIVNKYEAEILANLLFYILEIQQYTMEQVTVLSMYTGQVDELQKQIYEILKFQLCISQEKYKQYFEYKEKLKITSVDSFQGQESEIILLSTVRSNKDNFAGFLTEENRVNVAFSRARKGLFVIGNFELLYDQWQEDNIWTKIIDLSKKQGHYQENHFKLQCLCHKQNFSVYSANDIQKFIYYQPCKLKCGQKLSCAQFFYRSGSLLRFEIKPHQIDNDFDWNDPGRLIYNQLVVITNKTFDEDKTFMATVVNTAFSEESKKQYKKNKRIKVKLLLFNQDICQFMDQIDSFKSEEIFIYESVTYFDQYRNTLNALKRIEKNNFPFQNQILKLSTSIKQPTYINDSNKVFSFTLNKQDPISYSDINNPSIQYQNLTSDQWNLDYKQVLNKFQYEAFKNTFQRELSLIQGPPGTGKTYLGLKIVEYLIQNKKKWSSNKRPIVIFCQTNHALDQFLRLVLQITKNLVRVGGQSKELELQENNLQYLKQKGKFRSTLQILKMADVVGILQNFKLIQQTQLQLIAILLFLGFTISGGAKYIDLLAELQPQIVIIEEAAEILESQTLSVINEGLKHLIMIGDHKQLRPIMQSQEIINNNWNISLFERLIRNNIPSSFLGIQKRMRPEIADYIRLIYGNEYQDDESVKTYEDVKGFSSNVQLFSYQVCDRKIEQKQKYTKTIVNKYEAETLANLLLYILEIKQYTMEQITVLSMYTGQVKELKQQIYIMLRNQMFKSKENEKYYQNFKERIRITSVDSFQGEESEIILLSTVRSNRKQIAGFLTEENRINVAFSRARKGLFVIGNFELLYKARQENNIWTKVVDLSKKKGHYQQNHFKLQCRCHKKSYIVQSAKEIQNFIDQKICKQPCGQKLGCGHECDQICHIQPCTKCTQECV
ncbi:P-loop containing nucleoside triphosphate hydrolase [Pseudocohnilembus persalinus]|uniref:p-loop containing nucleoside triphosphate hydrolase n=1 Tax=Pseudocohnilembus persalinus TaxID=266149 RepID=A0A0V0QFM5_PSEPJ|nr:P-loop containing nucleoside triphosphate hydrolase [Pseudocohnilembus persalinus]|eukprot:KRX01009.1 P-loop containing nucleoside triphosphate hydrolase [Pseudocohnilembus persalinus]